MLFARANLRFPIRRVWSRVQISMHQDLVLSIESLTHASFT